MANIDSQIGMRPLKSKYGTVPQITEYTRSSTGVIYEGAVLYLGATGPAVYNGTTAAQGYNILGVAAAYHKSDDTTVVVYDDVDQLYEIQADGNAISTTTAVIESQAKYCNLVSHTAGNTLTGQSKVELDTSEVTSAQAAHDIVQLVALSSDPNNDYSAANEKWVVKLIPNVQVFTSNRTMST